MGKTTKKGSEELKPKDYLSQIRRYDVLIEQKIKERDELKKYDISAVSYGTERVSVSPTCEAPQVRTLEKIIEYEAEINKLIDELYYTRRLIIKQIQSMRPLEYVKLLYKRYVEYKRLEEIAVEMNYSYTHIRHLHGEALAKFGKEYLQ